MIRIKRIYVKKTPQLRLSFLNLQQIMEKKFGNNISEIRFTGIKEKPCLKLVLNQALAFQETTQIFKSLSVNGIEIKEFICDNQESFMVDGGNLEVTIS